MVSLEKTSFDYKVKKSGNCAVIYLKKEQLEAIGEAIGSVIHVILVKKYENEEIDVVDTKPTFV